MRAFPSISYLAYDSEPTRLARYLLACSMLVIVLVSLYPFAGWRMPNQPLFDIPVAEGRTGMIVVGGLNPVAALHEAGARVSIQSLAGLEEFSMFQPFQWIRDRFGG